MITAPALAGGAARDQGAKELLDQRRLPVWAMLLIGVVALSLAAGFFALGMWQVHRLHWKLDLIERIETRAHAEPAAAPGPEQWPAISAEGYEYRHVRLKGRFAHDRETFVQATTALGSGYWVMTPLETTEGFIVLVNQGFVPTGMREAARRNSMHTPEAIEIAGLLRMSEVGGAFLRTNDGRADRWYSRDVAAIADRRGLADVAPYFVDADRSPDPNALPVGGLTVLQFSNNHLVYALTWFALSTLPLCGLAAVARREWTIRRGARSGRR